MMIVVVLVIYAERLKFGLCISFLEFQVADY